MRPQKKEEGDAEEEEEEEEEEEDNDTASKDTGAQNFPTPHPFHVILRLPLVSSPRNPTRMISTILLEPASPTNNNRPENIITLGTEVFQEEEEEEEEEERIQ